MGIVIVGAGHAAGQAAASLRQEGYEGEIVIIGDEPHIPYQRPPLSKHYLAGEQGIERVYLRPEKFYADKEITLKPSTRVERIDRDGKHVVLDDGTTIDYDKLLLTTGSRPRILDLPGSNSSGIHYLRTIADVDAIKAEMESAQRLTVIGGGYIGLEVAAVATEAGLQVTILEMEDRILKRVTTPRMSEYYHNLHSGKGIDIRLGAAASGFAGDGRVEAVLCKTADADDVRIDTDIVVIGVGIVPNVELAAEAGLDCDNGIVVDDHARTSDPDIYAAGDCTQHPNQLLGRSLRLESVPNAMEQSRVAAANIAGGDKQYASVPWFWSDQYDLKLQMVGFSADGDREVVRGDMASNQFAVFYLKGDVLVAADAVNSAKEFMACRQLVGSTVDADKLADTEVDLKSLL